MNNKKRVLFLDDRSKRIHAAIKKFSDCDLTIVTNVKECLCFLSNNDYDEVWLDHDLGGEEFTDPDSHNCGMEIVRYLEKTEFPPHKHIPTFIIHSSNNFAAAAMRRRLTDIGFTVIRSRFIYE